MHVLATAGHVDHGKSMLVRALTGMEPDRWAEEHRRGMTIDLGYAWTTLADGSELAIVDVPGHERFIANMLTGLGTVPAVMFVVAADGGWARQSQEHLGAIDALGLQHGLLVITRADLADPSAARAESLERIARSSLGHVRSVAVSAKTGSGIPELRRELATLVGTLPEPDRNTRVRLWIDRAFSIRGSGTVVTGTLAAGSITVGDTLLLDGREVTARGLQSLGRDRGRVDAVARVAVNLRGVPAGTVSRGQVLLSPGVWHRTRAIDVRVNSTERIPNRLTLHIGTVAAPAHLRPLGTDTARIVLPNELPLLAGDRGVLRDPGRHAVVAGVEILDADPPTLHRRGAAAARGDDLAGGRPDAAREVGRRGAVRRDHLLALGVDVMPGDGLHEVDGWLVADALWQRWLVEAADAVGQWAAQHPVDPAMPLGALSQRLALPSGALLAPVLAAAGLAAGAGRVASSVVVTLGPAEAAVRTVEARLLGNPFDAPDRDELRTLNLGRRELAAAVRAGRLLRLAEDIVLLPQAATLAVDRLAALPQPFTTSQARQALGTTRRVAIPLLEHLDAVGHTQRQDGQTRRVTGGAARASDGAGLHPVRD